MMLTTIQEMFMDLIFNSASTKPFGPLVINRAIKNNGNANVALEKFTAEGACFWERRE